MARNTRQRIIEAALRLFNEKHFGNVTTAELAADLGITEGNLWYHFKSKRALLDVLVDQYADRAAERLGIQPGGENVLDDYARMLAALGAEVRDFRFIFRDRADYGETATLQAQSLRIYGATWGQFGRFFRALKAAGHLTVEDRWIDAFVTNSVIIIRFTLELFREMSVADDGAQSLSDWGMVQHLASFGDHLKPEARLYLLDRLGLKPEALPAVPSFIVRPVIGRG